MPFLSTPHTTMYYDVFEPDFTTTGRIPHPSTVLLIHGFGGTPESDFEGQLPALSRYRVVAPHLHGYGRSTQREAYTLTFYRDDAADLAMLLDKLGIEHTLVLGFSDGGIVGLLLAALYPQRVKALAVMGAQPTVNAPNAAAIRHWLLWRKLPTMYVEGQEALVAAGGVIITGEELASIRCPALIMHGKRDRVVPVDYARVIAERIPGSELLLFDAGHAAHIRCEQEYTAAVLDFFQRYL